MPRIPFSRTTPVGNELTYVQEAMAEDTLGNEGKFTALCEDWLEQNLRAKRAMLMPSCTAGLELAAIVMDIGPGDEIIMPSYTFVSTANAFVLRGATPVFVDIRPDTLNIDETLIEAAITPRTKAIVVVHYAGWPCDLQAIQRIADKHGVSVIEDAAQGLLSEYQGRALGTIGRFGSISFHTSKNIACGHGGALLINGEEDRERAEIVREKGTNRTQHRRGEVQKYTWMDVGSSFLLSELSSAYLYGQLERARDVNRRRREICARYRSGLSHLAAQGRFGLASEEIQNQGNGHIFYILCPDRPTRTELISFLKANEIDATFHYIPLHSSPAGQRFGRVAGPMTVTDTVSDTILRLPLFAALRDDEADRVIDAIRRFYR
jgi:dTDP-4-amino-4,6-dideoxygalactose transaminase